MSDFSTYFQLNKPPWKTLRYDTPLNANVDKIESGLLDWANANEPGSAGNYDEIVLTEGIKWRDVTNHVTKIRNASSGWDSILASPAASEVNASGSTDLTAWIDSLGTGINTDDPRYCIPVKIGTTTYYIPAFLTI